MGPFAPSARSLSATDTQALYTRTGQSDRALAEIPGPILSAYTSAADQAVGRWGCAIPWSVLAAFGWKESKHNPSVSNAAGAQGLMQFIPSTWNIYKVDGNGNGTANVFEAADAALGAANLLCHNPPGTAGAGSAATLGGAIRAFTGPGYDSYQTEIPDLAWAYSAPPPPTSVPPIGNLELVKDGFHGVRVAGWAGDADAGPAPIDVHIYVDGAFATVLPAAQNVGYRGDVAAAQPALGPNHGFDAAVAVSYGWHTVCAYGIDAGGDQNRLLGVCLGVDYGHVPDGSLDVVSQVGPSTFQAAGWATDRDDPANALQVHLYVDGALQVATSAGVNRVDVGAHGFQANVVLGAGTHNVCAYAINVGTGDENPLLGCKVLTFDANPFGSFDRVVQVPGSTAGAVQIDGWAADSDVASSISVAVYIDGAKTGDYPATTARADVGAAYPGWAAYPHGFQITVGGLAYGAHQVCVYALNVGAGSTNTTLTPCRSVTLSGPNPSGSFDQATRPTASTARLTGWAIDPDSAALTKVAVYVDGVQKRSTDASGNWPTGIARPDVAAWWPAYGTNRGFDLTIAGLTAGAHTVCVYAINVGAGDQNTTLLPCKAI